MHIEQANTQQT